jgi:hypothetical protein
MRSAAVFVCLCLAPILSACNQKTQSQDTVQAADSKPVPVIRLSNFSCKKNRTTYNYLPTSVRFTCEGILQSDDPTLKDQSYSVTLSRPPVPGSQETENQYAGGTIQHGVGKLADSISFEVNKGEKEPDLPRLSWKVVGYIELRPFELREDK